MRSVKMTRRSEFGVSRVEHLDRLLDLSEENRLFVSDQLRNPHHTQRPFTRRGAIDPPDQPFRIPYKHSGTGSQQVILSIYLISFFTMYNKAHRYELSN
jgi:hypothetical protein